MNGRHEHGFRNSGFKRSKISNLAANVKGGEGGAGAEEGGEGAAVGGLAGAAHEEEEAEAGAV